MNRSLAALALALLSCRSPKTAAPPRPADAGVAVTPDAGPPGVVAVRIAVPGRNPAEVERELVVPLENALGPARVEAVSAAGMAWVRVTIEGSREATLRALTAAVPAATRIALVGDAAGDAPRLRYVLADERRAIGDLRALHDEHIAARVAMVPGVLEVHTCGGGPKVWRVEVDPAMLAARGVALGEVLDALEHATAQQMPDLVLRGGLRLGDLAVVSLTMPGRCFAVDAGKPVLLGEVATRDAASLAAVREVLGRVELAGAALRIVDAAPATIIDLPPGITDEEAHRVLVAVGRSGVADLDREPSALPRLPSEIRVFGKVTAPPDTRARAAGDPPPPAGEEPELAVVADPEKLSAMGLATRDVDPTVTAAREGIAAGPARVWIPGGLTPSLRIGKVTLDSVARLERRLAPVALRRRGGARTP